MILVDVSSGERGWVNIRPLAYSAAFRDFMRSLPGVRWLGDPKIYQVPGDLFPIVSRQIESSGLARVQGFASLSIPPTNSGYIFSPQMRAYQIDGFVKLRKIMKHTGAALLADEPGLGKTAQSLYTIEPSTRTLIVCPAVVVPHWVDQIQKWLGRPAVRLSKKNIDDWVGFGVISYDTMRSLAKTMPVAGSIILDEIHYLSNSKSGRSKAIGQYVEFSRRLVKAQVIGLSGTPMLVRPKDLWHPLNVLWPERFGTWWNFTKRYCDGRFEEIPSVGAVWQCDGASNLDELKFRLNQLMVRRTRSECLELPDRIRQVIKVPLPPKILKQLQQAARTIRGDGQELTNVLQAIEPHKISAAVELAQDLIDQGQRPLILTMRRKSARDVGQALGCPSVDGETPADRRRATLLGSGGPGAATIYSVTTGIDLTAFNALIIVGLDWVPSTLLQSEARLHRIGQHSPVNIFYLVGEHTIDEAIRAKVIERLAHFDQAIGNATEETALAGSLGESEEDLIAGIIATIGER